MLGCFERSLFPGVSKSALALAPELAAPGRQGCCGALHAHNGEPERGRQLAKQLGAQLPGQIVSTAGGCAAYLAAVIGRDRVADLSEYLRDKSFGEVRIGDRRARVALQDSCHLRNGLGVWREPRALLAAIADYVELPDAGRCCGAAGTYALVRPRDSRRVLDPKLDQIEAAGIDYVVAVNPGCLRQLRQGLRRRKSTVRAVHIADLLRLAGADEPAGKPGHGTDTRVGPVP
jgi:glycolate oxidase iron-sulfur subunit